MADVETGKGCVRDKITLDFMFKYFHLMSGICLTVCRAERDEMRLALRESLLKSGGGYVGFALLFSQLFMPGIFRNVLKIQYLTASSLLTESQLVFSVASGPACAPKTPSVLKLPSVPCMLRRTQNISLFSSDPFP